MKKKLFTNLRFSVVCSILAVLLCGTLFISIYCVTQIRSKSDLTTSATQNLIKAEKALSAISSTTEYMTEQARLFVETYEPTYARSYVRELSSVKTIDVSMNTLRSFYDVSSPEFEELVASIDEANSIIDTELYAMRLVFLAKSNTLVTIPSEIFEVEVTPEDAALPKAKMLLKAKESLFEQTFVLERKQISSRIKHTIDIFEAKAEAQLQDIQNSQLRLVRILHSMILLQAVLLAITIFVIFKLILKPLSTYENALQLDQRIIPKGCAELIYLAETYNETFDSKERTKKNLEINAETDGLTKLLNRKAFDKVCEAYTGSDERFALLIIDFDNFKRVNDTYGHKGGDEALCFLSEILLANFRKSDYVIRLGGDEFAVIMTTFNSQIHQIIKRKIDIINHKYLKAIKEFDDLTISVGAAVSYSGYSEEVFLAADRELYKVKTTTKCDVSSCDVTPVNNEASKEA